MPVAQTTEIHITFTRRADPDPPTSMGEAYDANQIYRYTWIRIGTIKLVYEDRERARRVIASMVKTGQAALASPGPSGQPEDVFEQKEQEDAAFALNAHAGRVAERAQSHTSKKKAK